MQEFNFEVKYRKETENQVADHLSRLEDELMLELGEKTKIDDTFLDEHVLAASHDLIPWFATFANYLATDIVPSDMSFHQRTKFMQDVKISFGMNHIYIGVLPMGLFSIVYWKLRCFVF